MPSHFSWLELSCWNRLQDKDGTVIEWNGVAPHGLIALYPLDWREGRGEVLRRACEDCREEFPTPRPSARQPTVLSVFSCHVLCLVLCCY